MTGGEWFFLVVLLATEVMWIRDIGLWRRRVLRSDAMGREVGYITGYRVGRFDAGRDALPDAKALCDEAEDFARHEGSGCFEPTRPRASTREAMARAGVPTWLGRGGDA